MQKWVAKQREQYKFLKSGKQSQLTPDRLKSLESIGFAWGVRGSAIDEAQQAFENENDSRSFVSSQGNSDSV